MTEYNPFEAFGTTADEVDENPFAIPQNDYEVVVSDAGVKEFSDIPYLVVEFTITGDSEHAGKTASEMQRLTPWTAQERADYKTMNARSISGYKRALLSYGIAEDKLNVFRPGIHGKSLLGIKGTASIGPNKKGYNQISNFQRAQVASAPAASAPAGNSETVVDENALADLMSGF